MKIRSYTFEEYTNRVKSFHGYAAPGVVVGGFMIELAYQHLPKEGLFDAISETTNCLPDAVQLLTPCTVGNGWLRIIDLGRYAIALFDKHSGQGVRVFVDPAKLEAWSEVKSWFFNMRPKKEQDPQLLMKQIERAGADICSVQQIRIAPQLLKKNHVPRYAICPRCKESYPVGDGEICLSCQGKSPYVASTAVD